MDLGSPGLSEENGMQDHASEAETEQHLTTNQESVGSNPARGSHGKV